MEDAPSKVQLRQLLETAQYMILSTVNEDGSPHTSPVFFAQGRFLFFYWLSTLDAQHSQNIARDPRVSAVIMDTSHVQGTGYALYFNGQATSDLKHTDRFPNSTKETEEEFAIRQLCGRSQTLQDKQAELLAPDSPRKAFRLYVERASCNGAVFDEQSGLWVDRRVELPIVTADFRRYLAPPESMRPAA